MRLIPVYNHPAAGWPALGTSFRNLVHQQTLIRGPMALMRSNQPSYGFDCPGCAWPDHDGYKAVDICENGIKVVASETTSRRADAAFFARHPVAELRGWTGAELETAGRLVNPLHYDAAQDRWVEVSWEAALDDIAATIKALTPEQCAFYTSGRTSNEAAFIYQFMVRLLGTNNMPDCSNLCHEPTSVMLAKQIGIGKSTVKPEDFESAQLIILFGQNPASNHPRMLETLATASKRGCHIVAVNPLREQGLRAFANPQKPQDMLLGHATPMVSEFFQVRVGGDCAFIAGLCKWLLAHGQPDGDFIKQHTSGFEAFQIWLDGVSWDAIERKSGISQEEIIALAQWYDQSPATICTWGMGITQHVAGEDNVAMITNLLLLKGNIGKPGAGASPIRGHSNVQGDRTMGIHHKPTAEFVAGLEPLVNQTLPHEEGIDVVQAAEAIINGKLEALIGLGGNFAAAIPEPAQVQAAMSGLKLTVQIGIKLNETMLYPGQKGYILPCLGRTERDQQRSGAQRVSVEDSMCQVTPSQGHLNPASEQLRSEVDILCELAHRLFGPVGSMDWLALRDDYELIRERIAQSIKGFDNFNARLTESRRGFYLGNAARDRQFNTDTGKAQFVVPLQPWQAPATVNPQAGNQLVVQQPDMAIWEFTSIRSHDQFNTTIHGTHDRYRDVNRRDVLFVHPDSMAAHGLTAGQAVMVQRVDARASHGPLVLQPFDIAGQCVAAYYPECNGLFSLREHAPESGTPSFKSLQVRLIPV